MIIFVKIIISCAMRKLFGTFLAAAIIFTLAGIITSCKKDEPTGPNGGGGNQTVAVTGVSLSKTSLTLAESGSETLTATVTPSNATNKAVSWKSSDASVASVDNNGKVSAVKAGSATITVTTSDGGKTATCSVTVTSKTVSVTGVKLDKSNLELKAGETAQLAATVEPSDASEKGVEWTSSDTKIATVDGSGKVTAVSVGNATITATTKDGGKTASCSVTVNPVAVEGVSVEPAQVEVKEGKTVQLKATVSPAEADQEVEWTTSDSQIATVDANGLVTAIKPGTAYIVVRSKTYTDKFVSCEVTITQDDGLKGIAFDASEIQLETGQSRDLTVVFTPEYAANKNVTWASSDASVASVSDGKVVALKEGTATITATSEDGGHKAECVVTVSKASGPKVYAKHQGVAFTVNGVSDPMNGAFDSDSFKFGWVSYISADGNTLYSLESYYSDNGTQMWLCKDRKPIIDVTKYFTDEYDVSDFAARNGKFVILFTKKGNTGLFAVKAIEGEKYIDTYEIPGQGVEFYSPKVALAPNGDIHIVTEVKDAFWHYHMGWFTIPNSGSFTQKLIDHPRSGYVGVTNAGDVYLMTYKDEESGYTGVLYKNGVLNTTLEHSDENYYCELFCAGNDVYTAVMDFPGKKIMISKNGKSYQTVKLDMASLFTSEHSFWVTSNGDTYVCVYGHTDWNDTRIYKNGKLLYKSDSFRSICVVEE